MSLRQDPKLKQHCFTRHINRVIINHPPTGLLFPRNEVITVHCISLQELELSPRRWKDGQTGGWFSYLAASVSTGQRVGHPAAGLFYFEMFSHRRVEPLGEHEKATRKLLPLIVFVCKPHFSRLAFPDPPFSLCVWLSLRFSAFLPHFKNVQVRFIFWLLVQVQQSFFFFLCGFAINSSCGSPQFSLKETSGMTGFRKNEWLWNRLFFSAFLGRKH